MLSVSFALLVTICVCLAIGSRRSGKGGWRSYNQRDALWQNLDEALRDGIDRASARIQRVQRGLPGAYRSTNSLYSYGKNNIKDESTNSLYSYGANNIKDDIFWSGKNEAAIELEEESDNWDNYRMGFDEDDYIDDNPVKHVDSGDRMRPHQMKLMGLASDNARHVMDEGKCAVPTRRCVPIASDPEKKYWPRCALLHRCDDASGCCTSEEHSCQSKDSDHVDLYFYVFVTTEKNSNRGGVQRLTFRNDTSCECRTKPKVQPPICQNPTPSCTCPKHFESVTRNGQCVCDCIPGSASYKACRRYKRGKKFFTQKCLKDGKCSNPTCEYGPYLVTNNRCMRKSEKNGKRKMKSKYK